MTLKEVNESHNGAVMASLVYEVINDFGFEDNIGYFVTDNVDSNDKALEVLNQIIRENGGQGFDVKERRLRCLDHIINLVVKDLLFGQKTVIKNENKFKDKERDKDKGRERKIEDELKREATAWRVIDAIGKLHNIIAWIRRTSLHREAWINVQLQILRVNETIMLSADNRTRWNSIVNMIQAATKYKDSVKLLCIAEKDLNDDRLSDEDWKDLEDVLQLLKSFKDFTLYVQGKDTPQGSIISMLPSIIFLLGTLEEAKKQSRSSEIGLKASIELAWAKMDKYYKLTDESTAYAIAVVLNPRLKTEYLRKHWKPEEVRDFEVKLRARYQEYKEKIHASVDDENIGHGDASYAMNDVEHMLYGISTIEDELEDYLRTAPLKIKDSSDFKPIEWWVANMSVYPTLAAMAFDFLSIPAMSVEPERVFSG